MKVKQNWKYEKFKGDGAIYAICPICNFTHSVGALDFRTGEPIIRKMYKYCPDCGEYLYNEEDEIEIIWNERDILEK